MSAETVVPAAPEDEALVRLLPDPSNVTRVWFRRQGAFGIEDRWKRFLDAASGLRVEVSAQGTTRHVASYDRLPGIIRRLRLEGFGIWAHDTVKEKLAKHEAEMWVDLVSARDRLASIDADLKTRGKEIFPYQRVGIEWLATRTGGLFADDQGLGKTMQCLCALPPGGRILVVCPSAVKSAWRTEVSKFRPNFQVNILEGTKSFRWPLEGEVVVLNYDILPSFHEPKCKRVIEKPCKGCYPGQPGMHLMSCDASRTVCKGCINPPIPKPPEGVAFVVDEAHKVKNPESMRGESTRLLSRLVRAEKGRTWMVTGTPLMNRPEEVWNILDAGDLAYEAFGSRKEFDRMFGREKNIVTIRGKTVQKGWRYTGPTSAEAAEHLQRVMLRRVKTDVMSELPEKIYNRIPVDVGREVLEACNKLLKEFGGSKWLAEILEAKDIPFERISQVRAALASAKILKMLEIVEAAEEAEQKLVVFSAHRAPIDKLAKRKGWGVITGGVSAKEKGKIVEAFQAGELLGVGGTIGAMGTGVTLTASARMLFVDQAFTPAENLQAADRIHRIGQRFSVLIEELVANHPLDERLAEILGIKNQLVAQVVDAAREISR